SPVAFISDSPALPSRTLLYPERAVPAVLPSCHPQSHLLPRAPAPPVFYLSRLLPFPPPTFPASYPSLLCHPPLLYNYPLPCYLPASLLPPVPLLLPLICCPSYTFPLLPLPCSLHQLRLPSLFTLLMPG